MAPKTAAVIDLTRHGADAGLIQHGVARAGAGGLQHVGSQGGYQLLVAAAVHAQGLEALPTTADLDLFLLLVDKHVEVVQRHVVVGRDAVLLEV